MLIKFRKIKQLLTDAGGILPRAGRASLWLPLVHTSEVLDLGLGDFELRSEVFDTVVALLLWAADYADEAADLAAEDDHRVLFLVRE